MTPPPPRTPDPRRSAQVALLALLAAGAATLALRPSPEPAALNDRGAARLRIDPNTASRDELILLPGIGPTIADRLIAQRAAARAAGQTPAFKRPEDLDHVPRIGPTTIERIRPFLRFPRAGAPAPDDPAGPPR